MSGWWVRFYAADGSEIAYRPAALSGSRVEAGDMPGGTALVVFGLAGTPGSIPVLIPTRQPTGQT